MSTLATSADQQRTAYDETPYPSAAFPQTHPHRLAAMARLFGLSAADPAKARILELGCADGSNLLPMAEQLPEARFLGLDLSTVEITAGQKAIEATGLKNVELRRQNITEFPASEGKFDYIIAHGVYSWVPAVVREKILAICEEHLTENGVAYISYNALPGWNMRRALRDMMFYHIQNFPDTKTKVRQARALLAFLAESVTGQNSPYSVLLKNELSRISNYTDSFLLHDLLGAENTPFYFHEFAADAARHGLQYLSESSIAEMLAANFPEQVRQTLEKLNHQLVAQEQYMDFLRNRTFRQTLLCRREAPITRRLASSAMVQFSFRSLLRPSANTLELVPGIKATFSTATGGEVSSTDPFVKAVLWHLAETRSAAAVPYRELLDTGRTRSRPFLGELAADRDQVEEATLQANLLNLLAKGAVEIYASPISARLDVPEKPNVSGLARYEALNSRLVTNRVHQPVTPDLLARYVIAACDGARTVAEVVDAVVARAVEGKMQVNEGSAKVEDPEKIRLVLKPRIETALSSLARSGFFA